MVSGGTFTLPHRVEPPRCSCEHHAWNYYRYKKIFVTGSRLLYHYTIGFFGIDPLYNGYSTRFRQRNIGNPDKLMYNSVDITGMSESPPIEGMVYKHEPDCEWAAVDRELEEAGGKCTCDYLLHKFDDCKYHGVSEKAWKYRMHLCGLGIKR